LSIKNNIEKQLTDIQQNAENELAIDKKLDELVELLANSNVSSAKAEALKQRFNHAVKHTGDNNYIEGHSDEFSITLLSNQADSNVTIRYLRSQRFSKIVLTAISITMMVLGLGMIIMPAPPFFEMFTIFYFNQNDGITIMDLISLIIMLAGIYFLIKAIRMGNGRSPQRKI
jgi:hypothetical protein